jgi:endoglucanase
LLEMTMRSTAISTALATVALAGLTAPAALAGEAEQGRNPATPNPLRGERLFVDTDFHPAWGSYRSLLNSGRKNDANAVFQIAREPNFRWVGHTFEKNVRRFIRLIYEKTDRIGQPGAVPAITLFNHPHPKHQNPNQFGRRPDAGDRYTPSRKANKRALDFVRSFAAAVGSRRIVIAFEPDSLGSLYLLSNRGRRSRIRYMRAAIKILAGLPNATVYAEGGASDWRHARETARQLRSIGVHRIRGFMLNVTHFDTTGRSIAHGLKISRRLGGKPFVISTHANGDGPIHYRKRFGGRNRRVNVWCNPKNSAIGERPQTSTTNPRLDAYLWIGRPGYSAGTCKGQPRSQRGGVRAGFWWEGRGILLGSRSPSGPRFTDVSEPLRYPTVEFGG